MKAAAYSEFFQIPCRDPRRFAKLGIGALLMLASLFIPLLPLFFVAGYCHRICQRIIQGDGHAHLPEWDDWNGLLRDGFRLSEAGLLYLLPGSILLLAGSLTLLYPLIIASLMAIATTSPVNLSASAPIIHNGLMLTGAAVLLVLLGGFISTPSAMHLVATGRAGAIFDLRGWGRILLRAFRPFLLVYAMVAAATLLLTVLFSALSATLVFCLPAALLFSIAGFYLSVVASAMFAFTYRSGTA